LVIIVLGGIFRPRSRVVRSKSVYDLAISETSRILGKPPPPGVTLFDKMTEQLKYLPEATTILETPSDSAFAIENPIQAMTYFSFSLEGGIKHKGTIPARVIRYVDEFMADDTICDAQKEKIFKFVVDSYLVGHLAPVTVLHKFSGKLDELLLKTKCRTREEMLQELKKAQAQNESYEQMIHTFESGNKQMANELKNMSKKIKTTGADVCQIKSGTEQMAGDLAGISGKIEATGVDVVQIKEQTAGVPYFVDQDTKEARTDFQRINAMKVSMNLNDTEQKIVKYHDQEYTQEQIATQLNISLRTVQRHVTAIKKKFSKRGLPSPFVWNNRKKTGKK